MEPTRSEQQAGPVARDRPDAVAAARRRSMSERLELALAWNRLASELRAGLLKITSRRA